MPRKKTYSEIEAKKLSITVLNVKGLSPNSASMIKKT